jgi:RHS repeat-associated protein
MLLATSARAAGLSSSGSESAGVKEALARQLQVPGPAVVSQGASGGAGDSVSPAGEPVASLSTAFSDTWKTAHAGLVSRVFATPVNYAESDGKWAPIEDALTPRALGGYENTANSFSLTLPESLANGVTLTDQAGHSVSFSLAGAASALPTVSGDTATYAGVLPGTDLSYASESAGVQEVATLKGTEAPTELRYSLSATGGLSPQRRANGAIALVGEDGTVWFTIPAPRAFVEGANSATGVPLGSTLEASGSGWVYTVDTDAAWLREQLTTGAVEVDPSVESNATQACTLVTEAPTTSYCSSSTVQVGYATGAAEHHALLKFPVSSLPLGAIVMNAKLGLYVQSESSTTAKAVGVYRVTKPWTTAATWDTYDGTHAWTTAGGDYANPETDSDASVNSSVGGSTGWYYWYPTKMVQEWVNTTNAPEKEGYANEGLIVKDQTDNHTVNLLTLASPTASADKPYLEVSYEPRGFGSEPQYTQLSTQLDDEMAMSVNPASGNLRVASNDLDIAGTDGMSFSASTEFNNLDPDVHTFGRWTGSTQIQAYELSDGDVWVWDDGAVYPFAKQPNGAFATPPGIKAELCTAGEEHSACPATLPENTKWRLAFDNSPGNYVDLQGGFGEPIDMGNKYGDKLTAGFNEHGVLATWTDTGGRKIDYTEKAYDDNNHTFVNEIADVSGSRGVSFEYGPESEGGGSQLIGYTDANGKSTHFHYESYNLTEITLPGGEVVKLKYNSEAQVTELVRTTNSEHTEGPTTKLSYYAHGSAPAPCTSKQKGTVVKDPDWTKAGTHEVLYCSNVLDEVEKTVVPSEKAPGTEKEKKEREEDPYSGGVETTVEYNPFGDQTVASAASPGNSESGNTLSRVYDEAGVNVLCETTATSEKASSCEGASKSALVTNYAYRGTKTPYSDTERKNAEARSTTACYTDEEQTTEHGSEPACKVTTGPAGSLASQTDPLTEQNKLSYTYEADGNVETSTDADERTTKYKYDSQGQLDEIIPPTPLAVTTIKDDADGRPEVITEGAGHKTTITYDKDDRATKIVYSGTGTEKTVKYAYEPDGNLVTREDSTGTAKYTYDKLNRLTKEELPTGSNTYEYDGASNLVAFTDGGGTTKYTYNGLNELESMTEPGASKSTTFTYDGDGRVTKMTYPSGVSETYQLEATTGRPETITFEHTTGLAMPTLSYTYKEKVGESENNTELIHTVKEATGPSTTYTYDALNRLTEALTKAGKPANQSLYHFVLDGAGNRLQQTVNISGETGGKTTYYAYNDDNELECSQTVEVPCDGNAKKELSQYSYDGGGEETAITPKHETGGATFEYNAASELSSLTPSGGSALSLSYGGTGQDDLVGTPTTIQNSLLGITSESSSSASYYARTPKGLLIDERTPTGNYNPLYDAQGDVIALVSTTGKVERTFHYGPYGENIESEGTQTIPYPFGYKGGYRMPAGNTGQGNVPNDLLHYGQRYYDPTTGRWTQRDPKGGTEDLFAFSADDPVNLADPSGESAFGAACVAAAIWCFAHNIGEVYPGVEDGWIEEGIPLIEDGVEDGGEAIEVVVVFFVDLG